ncbi:MAG: hypothetical protein RLZZ609_421 [Cyanobacteriota bacterium]|jgi:hypothetical protein
MRRASASLPNNRSTDAPGAAGNELGTDFSAARQQAHRDWIAWCCSPPAAQPSTFPCQTLDQKILEHFFWSAYQAFKRAMHLPNVSLSPPLKNGRE